MSERIDEFSPRQMLERMFQVELSFMSSEEKDTAILAEAFHPDVVVHEPASLPYAGDWKGLEGISGLLQQMNKAFSHLAIGDLDFSGSPERLYVSCTLHMTCRRTDMSVTQPFAEVLRFEDGRLIEGTPFYFDTAEILTALGRPIPAHGNPKHTLA